MLAFYGILDLGPAQVVSSDPAELTAKLIERNAHHRTTIRRFLRRCHQHALKVSKKAQMPKSNTETSSEKPKYLKRRNRQPLRASLCIVPVQKESRPSMQLSKIQVECQYPAFPLHNTEHCTISDANKPGQFEKSHARQNMSVGVVNLCIDECEKQARMSKVYFDVLRRFNRSHIGRKIPIRQWRECPTLIEKQHILQTQRCFWSDENLVVSGSQHTLPKLTKML